MRASIHIKSEFGTSLNTREAATNLCKLISSKKTTTVDLDLSGVEFMSRSFADQFYKERAELRDKGIAIFLINANEEIEKILEAVSRTQNKKDREFSDIRVRRFSSMNDVSKFLYSI
jgi:anti-anti-sigma regulatory factor